MAAMPDLEIACWCLPHFAAGIVAVTDNGVLGVSRFNIVGLNGQKITRVASTGATLVTGIDPITFDFTATLNTQANYVDATHSESVALIVVEATQSSNGSGTMGYTVTDAAGKPIFSIAPQPVTNGSVWI